MSDPSKIGGGMAVALITTLYGRPLERHVPAAAEKLAFLGKQELIARKSSFAASWRSSRARIRASSSKS